MLYFQVKSADEARRLLNPTPRDVGAERVSLDRALHRVLYGTLAAPESLPPFRRAVVDGYAVRAADTFGAGAGSPAYLNLRGEVTMGETAALDVPTGGTVRIATGAMLPDSADAVVMVEYTDTLGDLIEVTRAAAPGEGIVEVGDDIRLGDPVLTGGSLLRPQDIGLLAGLGITEVDVYRRPRIAVAPTGDEVVSADQAPPPGKIRDINTSALCAAVEDAGCVPVPYPITPDDPQALRALVQRALDETDLVLIAGGSSVGPRDWTLEVLLSFPDSVLLLHGVSIRPGKPVIGVAVGDRLVVGLPGNPVSALVVFDQFVRPHLRRLAGEQPRAGTLAAELRARLTRSYASDPGKEDYVRVRLRQQGGVWEAEPILGRSTLLSTLTEADGWFVVPAGDEGLEAGAEIRVILCR